MSSLHGVGSMLTWRTRASVVNETTACPGANDGKRITRNAPNARVACFRQPVQENEPHDAFDASRFAAWATSAVSSRNRAASETLACAVRIADLESS